MNAIIAFCFLIILALLLGSISLGLKYYESSRRNKLVAMLRTVTENGQEQHVNLLIADKTGSGAMENALGSINFSGENYSADCRGWHRLEFDPLRRDLLRHLPGWRVVRSGPSLQGRTGRQTLFRCRHGCFPAFDVREKETHGRLGELEAQLPDALDFLSRSMRAGHAFMISLEMVGEEVHEPLGQEFRALFNEQNLGASLERSLASFYRRVPLDDVRFFSSAVLLQRQTGGNLAEILNRLSQIIRERFRLKGQVKAASGHGRLTATILTLLPIATLLGLVVTSPGYLDPMLTDPLGRRMIAAGVIAQIIGNFFIRKIIRIKV